MDIENIANNEVTDVSRETLVTSEQGEQENKAPVETLAEAVENGDVDQTQDQNQGEGEGDQQDSFPRDYVENLRKENAKYRNRAKHADALARRLFVAMVREDGRLADPNDLAFDEALLDDPEGMSAAIGDLIGRKPGLRAQQVRGDVGAGARGAKRQPPADLISIIRGVK